jgi:hypothetical protein
MVNMLYGLNHKISGQNTIEPRDRPGQKWRYSNKLPLKACRCDVFPQCYEIEKGWQEGH